MHDTMMYMSGWAIPEREPAEVALARMRELQESDEPHVSNQHLVSRGVLKEFAAPGANGKGWHLIPFEIKRKAAKKPLGLKGCGKSIDFLTVASSSAEKLWQEVEDRIPDAIAAARDGSIYQSESLLSTARDCLALHLVRSQRYAGTHAEAVAASVDNFPARVVDQHTGMFVQEFVNRHGGLLPGGRKALEAMAEPYVEKWKELNNKGVTIRASIESMFHRVRATFAPLQIQILRTPPGKELLISDGPCLTLQYLEDGRLVKPHVAIGDARTVAMPVSRDLILAVALEASDEFMNDHTVDLFNRLQMVSAFEYVYYRPGSNIAQWVIDYFKAP